MRELGSEYFKNTVYVNFEADRQVAALFQSDVRPDSAILVSRKKFGLENGIKSVLLYAAFCI